MNQNMSANMNRIMTANELKKFTELMTLISNYSEDLNHEIKQELLNRVIQVSGQQIQMRELDYYWKSYSAEEFCLQLAIKKVTIGSLNEAELIEVVKTIYEENSIGRLDMLINKYGDAIEYHFKKPEGSLINLIFDESNDSFDDVLVTLKKNDVIQL